MEINEQQELKGKQKAVAEESSEEEEEEEEEEEVVKEEKNQPAPQKKNAPPAPPASKVKKPAAELTAPPPTKKAKKPAAPKPTTPAEPKPKPKRPFHSNAEDPNNKFPYTRRPKWKPVDVEEPCDACAERPAHCMIVRGPRVKIKPGMSCFFCAESRHKCSLGKYRIKKDQTAAAVEPKAPKEKKGKQVKPADDDEYADPAAKAPCAPNKQQAQQTNAVAGSSKHATALAASKKDTSKVATPKSKASVVTDPIKKASALRSPAEPIAGAKRKAATDAGDLQPKRARIADETDAEMGGQRVEVNDFTDLRELVGALGEKQKERSKTLTRGINDCVDAVDVQLRVVQKQGDSISAMEAKFALLERIAMNSVTSSAKLESRLEQVEAENRRLLQRAERAEGDLKGLRQYISGRLPPVLAARSSVTSATAQTLIAHPSTTLPQPGSAPPPPVALNPAPVNAGKAARSCIALFSTSSKEGHANQNVDMWPRPYAPVENAPRSHHSPTPLPPKTPCQAQAEHLDHDGDSNMDNDNHKCENDAHGASRSGHSTPTTHMARVTPVGATEFTRPHFITSVPPWRAQQSLPPTTTVSEQHDVPMNSAESSAHALPTALALVTTSTPSPGRPAEERTSSSPVAENSVNMGNAHVHAPLADHHASANTVPGVSPTIVVTDQLMGNASGDLVDHNDAAPPEPMLTETDDQIVPPQSENPGADKAMSVHSHDAEGEQDDLSPIAAPLAPIHRPVGRPRGDPVAGPPNSVLSPRQTRWGSRIAGS